MRPGSRWGTNSDGSVLLIARHTQSISHVLTVLKLTLAGVTVLEHCWHWG